MQILGYDSIKLTSDFSNLSDNSLQVVLLTFFKRDLAVSVTDSARSILKKVPGGCDEPGANTSLSVAFKSNPVLG